MKLQLRSVVVDYPGGIRALDGVDLTFEPGQLVCLAGPNGSGKSTLLKTCAGLLEPTAGGVLLDERPLARLRPRERALRLASVPQILQALPRTSVERFVLGGRYAHGTLLERALGAPRPDDLAAVRRALAEADAADLTQRRLDELSGGQRQRVLVARALAQEASILLFDEPTVMLDPAHQVLVFELIARASAAGRTAVVATHDLGLAGCFADSLVLLDAGQVRASGPPSEVLRPEILRPVYGEDLLFLSEAAGGQERTLVVPWPRGDAG